MADQPDGLRLPTFRRDYWKLLSLVTQFVLIGAVIGGLAGIVAGLLFMWWFNYSVKIAVFTTIAFAITGVFSSVMNARDLIDRGSRVYGSS